MLPAMSCSVCVCVGKWVLLLHLERLEAGDLTSCCQLLYSIIM